MLDLPVVALIFHRPQHDAAAISVYANRAADRNPCLIRMHVEMTSFAISLESERRHVQNRVSACHYPRTSVVSAPSPVQTDKLEFPSRLKVSRKGTYLLRSIEGRLSQAP